MPHSLAFAGVTGITVALVCMLALWLRLPHVPTDHRLEPRDVEWLQGALHTALESSAAFRINGEAAKESQARLYAKAYQSALQADQPIIIPEVHVEQLLLTQAGLADMTAEGCAQVTRQCIMVGAAQINTHNPLFARTILERVPSEWLAAMVQGHSRQRWIDDWRAALYNQPSDWSEQHLKQWRAYSEGGNLLEWDEAGLSLRANKLGGVWKLTTDSAPPSLWAAMSKMLNPQIHDTVAVTICRAAQYCMLHGLHELAHPGGPVSNLTRVTLARLQFDQEQLQHLESLAGLEDLKPTPAPGPKPPPKGRIPLFQRLLASLQEDNRRLLAGDDHTKAGVGAYTYLLGPHNVPLLTTPWDRSVHIREPGAELQEMLAESPLNPELDVQAIEQLFAQTGVAVVDNILRVQVLEELRMWCLESTIFHHSKQSYVGSYWQDGFNHPLVLHVARALQRTFSFIKPHHLSQAWAYAYSNLANASNKGIGVHADQATVNVNMWVTPNEANLAPETGGLRVWLRKPPASWNFMQVNGGSASTISKILEYLEGAESQSIQYAYNRAVIFNSELFHSTTPMRFALGHQNRRINFTFLYGVSFIKGGTPGKPPNKQGFCTIPSLEQPSKQNLNAPSPLPTTFSQTVGLPSLRPPKKRFLQRKPSP
eukprot:TRINITY_DN12622_c0_g1_i1.p1 TRINITY_DN12622_c0_g1~~TRINITY_DN12622_c0_g1_i1.p1  ORF type:complete len:653 (+),score=106.55 TRINITY_DN12622_c0_g1_i1:198-2156(+)